MRTTAKDVLRPIAVKAEELKSVLREFMFLEPMIEVASNSPTMLCPIPVNMVDGKKSRFCFRATNAFVSIGGKNLRTKAIPKLQSLFLLEVLPPHIANVPEFLLTGLTMRYVTLPIAGKTAKVKRVPALGASSFSRSRVELPMLSASGSKPAAPPFCGSVSSTSATGANDPPILDDPEMAGQEDSPTMRASSVSFHGDDYISHGSYIQGVTR